MTSGEGVSRDTSRLNFSPSLISTFLCVVLCTFSCAHAASWAQQPSATPWTWRKLGCLLDLGQVHLLCAATFFLLSCISSPHPPPAPVRTAAVLTFVLLSPTKTYVLGTQCMCVLVQVAGLPLEGRSMSYFSSCPEGSVRRSSDKHHSPR